LSGGSITAQGISTIIKKGVCWNTTQNPTIENPYTVNGAGMEPFISSITGLSQGQTYFVRAYAMNSTDTAYGNQVSFITSINIVTPSIITTNPTNLTQTTVKIGGNIISDGGADVTERGICWNTTGNPTKTDNPFPNGIGIGEFSCDIISFSPGQTCHIKAYASNNAGTAYGNEIIVTTPREDQVADADLNLYNIITIGSQVWMKENLKTTKYNNGTEIQLETEGGNWITLVSGAYCWYDNNETDNKATYGALYNWYAVNTNMLCPSGWHVPSHNEWRTLALYLQENAYQYDGVSRSAPLDSSNTTSSRTAKSLGARTLWAPSSTTGAIGNTDYDSYRNKSGFTAYPGGYRYKDGNFVTKSLEARWWASVVYPGDPDNASYIFRLVNEYCYIYWAYGDKIRGNSIRCLKDQ
jgi:uncharacterized protein (TIGR02145 family)